MYALWCRGKYSGWKECLHERVVDLGIEKSSTTQE